jgi:DNA mismatch repair protein MSH3
VEGLDDDTVTGAPPTFGTLMCICEQAIGGKGSDEKVVFGIVAAQPSTGEVIYDRKPGCSSIFDAYGPR